MKHSLSLLLLPRHLLANCSRFVLRNRLCASVPSQSRLLVQDPGFRYMVELLDPQVQNGGHNDFIQTFGGPIAEAILTEIRAHASLPSALVSLTADFYKAPRTERNVLQITLKIATSENVLSYELDPTPAPETKGAYETAQLIIAKLGSLGIEAGKVVGITTDSGT